MYVCSEVSPRILLHPAPLTLSFAMSIDFNRFVNVSLQEVTKYTCSSEKILSWNVMGWRIAKNSIANRCPVEHFNIMYLTGHSSTLMHQHWKNALPGSVWKLPVISEALEPSVHRAPLLCSQGLLIGVQDLYLHCPFYLEEKNWKAFFFWTSTNQSQLWQSFTITSHSLNL